MSVAVNSNLIKTSGVQNADFYKDLLHKSKDTLADCTFWTFEDVLLPALKYSLALKRLILENYFTL